MPPHVNVHVEMIMSALKMKLPMLSKSARCNRGLRTGAAGRCALAAERPIPVGIVSHTYSLAPHREVASLCRRGLVDAGIEPSDLRYEVGVSELGEWMNLTCDSGKDIEIDDPFAPGAATEKPIRYLAPVPGAPERASTKYDVAQAMSFVATQRKNAEERLAWQNIIPRLLERLSASSGARAR